MTPKCGRIDVKYANCSYHTRIGLGKWTHDPTLHYTVLTLHMVSKLQVQKGIKHTVSIFVQQTVYRTDRSLIVLHVPKMSGGYRPPEYPATFTHCSWISFADLCSCVAWCDAQGKKVLELGCGHGMPGILAMLAGAEVHFQVGPSGMHE